MVHINWQRTRDILISIICIGIVIWASWSFLGQFIDAIIILLLSMAVAFLLHPVANILEARGIPRILATLLIYLVVLGLLSGLVYLLVGSLFDQASTFAETVRQFATSLPQTLSSTIDFLEKQLHIPNNNIQSAIGQVQTQATTFASELASGLWNMLFVLSNTLVDILLVIVLSFYLTLDGQRIRQSIFRILPRRWLKNAQIIDRALNQVVGNYIRGQLTLAVIVGVATGLICVFNGLGDYALICGTLAFLFETIPMIGPFLASITPLLLSLLLPPIFPRILVIAVCFIVLQAIESNILGPRIVGHAVGLHPVAAILALLMGTKLFGLFGALIATPLVAAAWVVITSIYQSTRKGETTEPHPPLKRASWKSQWPERGFSKSYDKAKPPSEHDEMVSPSSTLPSSQER